MYSILLCKKPGYDDRGKIKKNYKIFDLRKFHWNAAGLP
jgi:hypothetical protein